MVVHACAWLCMLLCMVVHACACRVVNGHVLVSAVWLIAHIRLILPGHHAFELVIRPSGDRVEGSCLLEDSCLLICNSFSIVVPAVGIGQVSLWSLPLGLERCATKVFLDGLQILLFQWLLQCAQAQR